MSIQNQTEKLATHLQGRFPEAHKRLQNKKPLTKTQLESAGILVIGFLLGLSAAERQANPYITINYSCGRVDRLFTDVKKVAE